jgi:hypothetical protein
MFGWDSLWWMGPSQVESDNVRLGVSVWDGFEKDLKLIHLIIFTSSNACLLIVRCSYTKKYKI